MRIRGTAVRQIMNRRADIVDKSDSFGWISIALHWVTAAVVLSMWFIGQSISAQSSVDGLNNIRDLHIAVGLVSWILLAGRIVWRMRFGHPRVDGQTLRTHRIARSVHYLMLLLLGCMLLTGPSLAWLSSSDSTLLSLIHLVHRTSANILFAIIVLHILASLKHLMFHEDDTIVRMLMPKK